MPATSITSFAGLGSGPSARMLYDYGFDLGALRPWREVDGHGRETGRAFISVNGSGRDKEGKPTRHNVLVTNTPALLRREDWLIIDREINWAAKLRLQFAADVYGTNPYNIPDGLSVIAIQHAVATGNADAVMSMEAVRKSERSRPVLDVGVLPLPITHSDGSFPLRELRVARRSGMPLDTTGIQLASRAVAEVREKLYLGVLPAYSYAGGTIYGARNYPSRITAIVTTPTTGGWTPQTTYNEILNLIQTLEDNLFYGPYVLYHSTGWGRYMDIDYNQTYPTSETLRTKLGRVAKIRKVQAVDYLPDYEFLLVQMTPDVIRGVQGMPLTTLQWDEPGGMESGFKVMEINVPQLRTDYRGLTGILHAVAYAGGTTTTSTTTTTTTTTAAP